MIDLPIIHKRDFQTKKTKCGLSFGEGVRFSGLYKLVTCEKCLALKSEQARYYDETKDIIKIPVVEINNVDMSKLRAFFNKKSRKMIESLEDFIKY